MKTLTPSQLLIQAINDIQYPNKPSVHYTLGFLESLIDSSLEKGLTVREMITLGIKLTKRNNSSLDS